MTDAPAADPSHVIRLDGGEVAVYAPHAEAAHVCLFDEAGRETQIQFRDYDAGVWHAFVPGIRPGQAYGYRATGPYDPARGVRCNPAKLLLDPYARAISGSVTSGVLGTSIESTSQKINLAVGKSATENLKIATLGSLTAGSYFLVVQVTDPAGKWKMSTVDAYGNLVTTDSRDQVNLTIATGPGVFAGT